MKITIIGAGIAGLTTAIALNKIGIETRIFEAAPHLKPVGAGLGLAPNAIKAFRKIGIADKIIPLGRQLPYFKILTPTGKIISVNDSLAISAKFGTDNFTIHRAQLHEALLNELDAASIFLNKRAVALESRKEKIKLTFADNTTYETDFLIVADGINSALRNLVIPAAKVRYAGYTCWRAVIQAPDLPLVGATETWGANGRFGLVPLTQNQLYWFACINATPGNQAFQKISVPDLAHHFRHYHEPIPDIISRTPPEGLIHNDIYDLAPLPHFAYQNILFIGDAAHATTPNLGQGACQAIEDAVILTNELTQNNKVEEAFVAFEKKRLSRTRYVTQQSRRIGEVAQWRNPVLVALRNTALRLVPTAVQQKQFNQLYNVQF